MTLAAPTITVYFGLDNTPGDFFTIGHTTKGVIGSATYVIAGDVGSDIAADGYEIAIRRGRSRELDEFEAGSCDVRLRNLSRDYDDTNALSPYVGTLTPGKRVVVTIWGHTVFAGVVEDWNNEWTVDGEAVASFFAIDGLGELGLREFAEWTTTGSQLAGARITDVLNRGEVNYPIARDLDTGVSTLQSDVVTWGSNVLNYLQLVARSDAGRVFATRDNVLRFQDRHALVNPTSGLVFTDSPDAHDAYLDPSVGTATTPALAVPNQVTWVFRVRGPGAGGSTDQNVAGQWTTAGNLGWAIQRRKTTGQLVYFVSSDGTTTAGSTVNAQGINPGVDETIALSMECSPNRLVNAWTYNAGTWTAVTGPASVAGFAIFNTGQPIRIGAIGATGTSGPWDGRIYSVELRSGLDPDAGSVLWRFDASEYPGTGTSYVDPRGRTWTLTDADAVIPSNDGGIRFHGITTSVGADLLYNRVGVDREGGTLQTAEDADSQAAIGIRALGLSGLLLDSDTTAESLAGWLLNLYRTPQTRIASVMVKLHDDRISSADRGAITGLDIGDVITVSWTPQRIGDPLTQTLVVEGVEHRVSQQGEHVMEILTSLANQVGVFIIGDATYGRIGPTGGVIAF